MKVTLVLAAFLSIAAANASASGPGDPFAAVRGIPIGGMEAESIEGGDMFMRLNKERNKLEVHTEFPSKTASGLPTRVSFSYSMDAHNRVVNTKGADFMPAGGAIPENLRDKGSLASRPEGFPAGVWNVTAVKERKDKFGPYMISTDAVGVVEVFDAKGNSLGRYKDAGYAIHSNTNDFKTSQSWGCVILREEDNRRLAEALSRDVERCGRNRQKVMIER